MRDQSWPDGKPPPWPHGTLPPWREDERPALGEVIRAYPGRAIGNVFLSLFVGGFASGLILPCIALVLQELDPNLVESPLVFAWAVPAYVLVAAAWWFHEMDGQNRGWWTWDQD